MSILLQQANFADRANFGKFLNKSDLQGVAVEVGTHRADFAHQLLDQWKGKRLYCVDPWGPVAGYEAQAESLKNVWKTNGDRTEDFIFCQQRLKRYGDRVKFIQATSAQAIHQFKDGTLDFVYVDGDHRYEMVLLDLRLWWPKIKQGGILAGHDFVCHGTDSSHHDIQEAVFEFMVEKFIKEVWQVVEIRTFPWSFILKKEG